ncbi:MAG TPA: efflux RND transporter periplasmic adaptor subunit [Candidatus Kapabacteria bacterium]|jgi:RND family efflux transporter MFP subunit|nr:efflux RND transporter periplasmic adaptor subunit [Ignavibacteria bacterium]HRE59156.1 efflux RND transporter periplasmic adaptor subunit [Candidatus Kapabacteria bacterium]HRK58489.1 efflux RND transporter periplasmic adaptor subunit [Candidatus Kapabacteria bacterium]
MAGEIHTTDLSTLKINRTPQTQSSNTKWIIIAIILCCVIGGGYFLMNSTSVEVETMQVFTSQSSSSETILTGQGYVVAQRKAAISSKATGRLDALYVIEGDKVKQGDIIGRIESADVQAALDQQKAQLEVQKAALENATAELEDAEISLKRQQELRKENVGTQADLDAAINRVKKAKAQIQSAKASIATQESAIRASLVQVENTIIRAPFDGTILNKNANVGEVITALGGAAGSRGAVVTLADMTSLQVEADVSESAIQKIQENQPVEISVSAISDKKYKGIVNKIIPTADRAKGTVQVKIRFDDIDERVLPEMGAKVNFLKINTVVNEIESKPKLLIPQTAIQTKNGKKTVFVVKDNAAQETAVSTGTILGEYVEITNGLMNGDVIILAPSDNIQQGSKVQIKK